MPLLKDILDEKLLKDLCDAEFKAVLRETGLDYEGAIHTAYVVSRLIFILEIQKDIIVEQVGSETFEKCLAGIKSLFETACACVEVLRLPAGPPEAAAGKMT